MSHDRFTPSDSPLGGPLANNDINGGADENLFADAYHSVSGPFDRNNACGSVFPGRRQADLSNEGGFGGPPNGGPQLEGAWSHFGRGPLDTDSAKFAPLPFGAPSMNDSPPLMRELESGRDVEAHQFSPRHQPGDYMPPPDFRADNTMPPGLRHNFMDGADRAESPEFGPLSLLSGDNALTDDQKNQLRALRDDDSNSSNNSHDLRQDQQKLQELLATTNLNAQDIKDMQSTINSDFADRNNSMIEQRIKIAEILTPEQRSELSQKLDRGHDQIYSA